MRIFAGVSKPLPCPALTTEGNMRVEKRSWATLQNKMTERKSYCIDHYILQRSINITLTDKSYCRCDWFIAFYCFQLSFLCSSSFNVHGKLIEQATIKRSNNTASAVVERHTVLYVWGGLKAWRRQGDIAVWHTAIQKDKTLDWQDISKQLESGGLNAAAAAGGKSMTMAEWLQQPA